MNADRKTLLLLLCLAGGTPALTSCGGDDVEARADRAATARPAPSPPLKVALKPEHRSGVTGTATLVGAGADVKVTLTLDKRVPGTLLAHIHTGPCSDEPTMTNPRIWATLTEVVDGHSETTENIATLQQLRSETSSINVHDPTHANRALVCGDIPRAS
jgi:hypothetical protein